MIGVRDGGPRPMKTTIKTRRPGPFLQWKGPDSESRKWWDYTTHAHTHTHTHTHSMALILICLFTEFLNFLFFYFAKNQTKMLLEEEFISIF